MNLHDGTALIVNPSGVPGETFLVRCPHSGLQGYLFPHPAFSQEPHLPYLHGNHRSSLRWIHCNDVEADQLQKGLEKIGRVLVPCVPQMSEITCLPVGGSAPHHPWTCTVKS